ncbi:hypothetical protein E1301_Tti013317 [Triplophysa tibetana]|uniref:HECT domain-containing protein n=1 Tax=Triplophysa tibetana TaxID=1572043 RepID=A0A5A9MZW5_9TELE|nr:hypothetical protein E1301_Tti013317 [Triplophysa tibetana]
MPNMSAEVSCGQSRATCLRVWRRKSILEDILELLAGRVNAENQFRICVSRDNLLERGLKQWQRQKKGNPANQLKITFIGEAGIDSGALRKEFLTAFQVAPMLGDLRKGIQLYGFLDIVKDHPSLCKSLFVPGEDCTPDADYILSNVAPEMSERGTSRALVESKIINYFQDFLQEIECGCGLCIVLYFNLNGMVFSKLKDMTFFIKNGILNWD